MPGDVIATGESIEWGEAAEVAAFYGRADELARLARSVRDERCRVVAVLGLGGIGKIGMRDGRTGRGLVINALDDLP